MLKRLSFTLALCFLFFSLIAQHNAVIINHHNWLFVNMSNRMNIILNTIPYQEVKIWSNLGHSITVDQDGSFIIKPTSSRTIELRAYHYKGQDSTLLYQRKFSVKPLPKATTTWGGRFKTEMSKSEFLSQRGLKAEVLNYDYDLSVPIKRYSLLVIKDGKPIYFQDCVGAKLDTSTKVTLSKLLRGGERVLFTNIEVTPYYHFNKFINSIEIKISSPSK